MLNTFILASATVAGWLDLRFRRIPNWLVVAMTILTITWHTVVNGFTGLRMSLVGLVIGLAVLFPIFLLRGIGAGDVKLLGALGAAFTSQHIVTLFVISALIAGAMAVVQVFWSRALIKTIHNLGSLIKHFFTGKLKPHEEMNIDNEKALKIPFGVSVALATWLFIFFGTR